MPGLLQSRRRVRGIPCPLKAGGEFAGEHCRRGPCSLTHFIVPRFMDPRRDQEEVSPNCSPQAAVARGEA